MLDACRANGVQFMDGTMFMRSQRLTRIKQAIGKDRRIGKIIRTRIAWPFWNIAMVPPIHRR